MTTVVDPKTAPPSVFPAHDGAVYEQAMGRWSRRLAPLLIEFGGLADGDRVLDVGCGTGSLSYALPEAANVAAVTGIDQAEVYLAYARRRSADPRFIFRHADARALPFADGSFDRAFSMLVLSFITDIEHAVAEMRCVVRPGRTGDCSSMGPCRFFRCCGTPQPRSLEPPNGRAPCSRR